MTKTIAKIAAGCDLKSGEPGMMQLDAMADGYFVWPATSSIESIFEFGSRAAQAIAPRVGVW
jgi:hypothetical protein